MSFRHTFWTAGTIELILALICLFSRRLHLQAALLAWLATKYCFISFRLGKVGYQKPCRCFWRSHGCAAHLATNRRLCYENHFSLSDRWQLWNSFQPMVEKQEVMSQQIGSRVRKCEQVRSYLTLHAYETSS